MLTIMETAPPTDSNGANQIIYRGGVQVPCSPPRDSPYFLQTSHRPAGPLGVHLWLRRPRGGWRGIGSQPVFHNAMAELSSRTVMKATNRDSQWITAGSKQEA